MEQVNSIHDNPTLCMEVDSYPYSLDIAWVVAGRQLEYLISRNTLLFLR